MSVSRLLINLAGHHRYPLIWRSLATNASPNKSSLEQLTLLEQKLAAELPNFFKHGHNYSLYTKDVVFIDNTRNIRSVGIYHYMLHIQLVRIYYNIRYSSIRVELLNLVKNPEESYLRIRWRVVTRPGAIKTTLRVLTRPDNLDEWKDGISTMHVNRDGKIYCHVCDNIDVDTNDIEAKQKSTVKNPLVNRGLNVCNKPRV